MTYKNWWYTEGSEIRPLPNEDIEEFAKRITEIAWSNGQYKEREACAKIVELNADACRSDGVAQIIIKSNAEAIRGRGEA